MAKIALHYDLDVLALVGTLCEAFGIRARVVDESEAGHALRAPRHGKSGYFVEFFVPGSDSLSYVGPETFRLIDRVPATEFNRYPKDLAGRAMYEVCLILREIQAKGAPVSERKMWKLDRTLDSISGGSTYVRETMVNRFQTAARAIRPEYLRYAAV